MAHLRFDDTLRVECERHAGDADLSRVEHKQGFRGFQSHHPDTHLSREERDNPLELDRPIQAWPPGYSNDKRVALVRLSIPWSIHSAVATYLLSKTSSGWIAVRRDLAIYV